MIEIENKPYLIAQICYNPSNKDFPWYCVRTGTIAGQGGPHFGRESVSFKALQDVFSYLSQTIERDLPEVERIIEEKSKS